MHTGSVLSYLWLSMGMGALSLLTPCVFPMIPITISYFANHSSVTGAGSIRKAAVCCVGIMLTFVALGMSPSSSERPALTSSLRIPGSTCSSLAFF
jgi:cytochrome c biogenesis protein CcdA